MSDQGLRCLKAAELSDYSLGKLSIEQNRQIEVHLDGCTKRKTALTQIDDSHDDLVSSLRSTPKPKAAESEIKAIIQGVTEVTQIADKRTRSSYRDNPL